MVRGAGGAGARASVGDEGKEAIEDGGGRDASAIVASTGGMGFVVSLPYCRWWFSTVARDAFFRISMRTYSMCTGTYLPGKQQKDGQVSTFKRLRGILRT